MATIDRRSTRDGRIRWRVRIRRRGVTETASFGSRTEAVRWAREMERRIDLGEWQSWAGGEDLEFSRLLDRYVKIRGPSRDTRRQLEWWREQLGDQGASAISTREILQLRQRLTDEPTARRRPRSAATVNRYMAALSGLFSWALREGAVPSHPARGIEPLAERPARIRFLSSEERETLIEACRRLGGLRLQVLVILALTTGARRGELLRLRWSDVDLIERQITFRGSRGGRSRTLPLSANAVALLREMSKVRRIDGDELFANAGGRVIFPRAAWQSAVVEAGIDDFRFHDLRHSAASYLAMSGASLAEIAEILGIKTLQTVRRYSHLARPRTSNAMSRMHDEMFDE